MHLVIIGGNSAEKINQMIQQNFDNIRVSVYPSIPKFVEVSDVRTIDADRFILLQDAFSDESNLVSIATAFNDYLGKYYSASKFVALVKSESMQEVFSEVFISPLMVTLCLGKMNSLILTDIVSGDIDLLRKRYVPEELTGKEKDFSEEVVLPVNEKKEKQQVKNKNSTNGSITKKRGGILGLFKREKNKKEEPDFSNSENERIEDEEETYKHSNTEQGEPESKQVEPDDGLNYSLFTLDGEPDLGLGVSLPKGQDTEPIENLENTQTDTEEDLGFIDENEDDHFIEENIELLEFEETDENYEFNFEDTDLTEIYDKSEEGGTIPFNIDGDTNPDYTEEDDTDFSDIETSLKENETKWSRLKDEVLDKVQNIEKPVESENLNTDFKVEEVDDLTPLEGVRQLSDQYEEQSKQVVEKIVEKIVEVPVERVVEVQTVLTVGEKKKTYKNGIRTIVVTGDRKTGVTRTSLNMAAHYAKTESTLYVDLDIARRGSLLYFGLENIAKQEEHVQNGLTFFKNLKTLKNVVYTFPKGGFDCLVTTHGSEVTEEQILLAQRLLVSQRTYKTLIIDCPLENLNYLEDIILYSEIVLCMDSSTPCILNTILELSKLSDNERFGTFLYNNSSYFLSGDDRVDDFKKSLAYIGDIFSLDGESDWTELPLLGSVTNFTRILEAL